MAKKNTNKSIDKNTGIPFEKKIAGIYEQILALDGPELKNLKVIHNAKLDSISTKKKGGKPQTHQIDVYWEFELAGNVFRVCIQAKDWKRKVTMEQVLAFRGVLNDIAGQPKGIMIASNGFQSGALDHAQTHGIELLVLDAADQEESKSIRVNFAGYRITPTDFKLFADEEWNKANGFTPGAATVRVNTDMPLILEDGSLWGTLGNAIYEAIPKLNKIGSFSGEFVFPSPTFALTDNPDLPRSKLHKVWAQAEVSYSIQPVEVRRAVTNVLRSITNDKKYLVDDFGKLVMANKPFEASGLVEFPDGHKMQLSIVNIGHLSEEAKKEYRESLECFASDSGNYRSPRPDKEDIEDV
ncbi:MAG: restriction endonuclease [Candidatus Obscuribacterales bacterium]|nr:restriction endonuclease [Candidatus Obscuribacterales bacterium]